MSRLLLNLGDIERAYLVRRSKETGLSMAALVRQAILRQQEAEQASLEDALAATRGIWRRGDGLRYQRSLRNEWK
jgi:hypothetical protein